MRKSAWRNRSQLVLDLEPRPPQPPLTLQSPQEAVAALADLLLSAMGIQAPAKAGGDNEL